MFHSWITMYRAPAFVEEPDRRYERVDRKTLDDWYASFSGLTNLAANEALLGVLETAEEDGYAAAHDRDFHYVFFEGRHPASSMAVDKMDSADLCVADVKPDALDIELGARRIAWSPKAYHGSFRSPSTGLEAFDHEIELPWRCKTRDAVLAFGRYDFENCETFFGERVLELAREVVNAKGNRE